MKTYPSTYVREQMLKKLVERFNANRQDNLSQPKEKKNETN